MGPLINNNTDKGERGVSQIVTQEHIKSLTLVSTFIWSSTRLVQVNIPDRSL